MTVAKRMDPQKSEEAREAYELSLAGYSQRQIGDKMGHSQSWVRDRLKLHIENRVHRKADEWRDRQLDDLMVLRRKLVGAIESGDTKAIGQAVRIWERISRLIGTDSAQAFKVEVEQPNDPLEVAKMMARMFGGDPDEITEAPPRRNSRPRVITSSAVATEVEKPAKNEFPDAIPAHARPTEEQREFEPAPEPLLNARDIQGIRKRKYQTDRPNPLLKDYDD